MDSKIALDVSLSEVTTSLSEVLSVVLFGKVFNEFIAINNNLWNTLFYLNKDFNNLGNVDLFMSAK